VFTAPWETVYSNDGTPNTGNWAGYHSAFAYGSTTIYYAVIPYPNAYPSSDPFNQMTQPISHELAEAVTDAVPYTGWYDPQLQYSKLGGEIGDIADTYGPWTVHWDGFDVQPIVNQNDRVVKPLLPATSSLLDVKVTSNQLSPWLGLGTFQDLST